MENITLQPAKRAPLSGMDFPENSRTFTPKGVCAKLIRFSVEDNKISYLNFIGGCEGNLKAISALVKGMEIEQIIELLSGITCGKKKTSCADQLCTAMREYMAE